MLLRHRRAAVKKATTHRSHRMSRKSRTHFASRQRQRRSAGRHVLANLTYASRVVTTVPHRHNLILCINTLQLSTLYIILSYIYITTTRLSRIANRPVVYQHIPSTGVRRCVESSVAVLKGRLRRRNSRERRQQHAIAFAIRIQPD